MRFMFYMPRKIRDILLGNAHTNRLNTVTDFTMISFCFIRRMVTNIFHFFRILSNNYIANPDFTAIPLLGKKQILEE